MLSPYDNRTEETRNKLIGNRATYSPNQYYKSAEGNVVFYINTKGYYHIVAPCRVNVDGVFSHYVVKDNLLTKDNKLKEVRSYGYYQTIEDVSKAILSNVKKTED